MSTQMANSTKVQILKNRLQAMTALKSGIHEHKKADFLLDDILRGLYNRFFVDLSVFHFDFTYISVYFS